MEAEATVSRARGGSELTMGNLVSLVLRRWWVIALAGIIVFAGVYAAGSRLGKQYQSVALLRILTSDHNAFNRSGTSPGVSGSASTAGQEALLLTTDSPSVQQTLRTALGHGSTDIKSVQVAGLQSSPLVRITVVAHSATLARSAADDIAKSLVTSQRNKAVASDEALALQLRGALPGFQRRITALNASLPKTVVTATTQPSGTQAERDALVAQYQDYVTRANELDVQARIESGGLAVEESATLPASPFYPKALQWALLAALVAVVLATAVLWARGELRGRARRGTSRLRS